MSDVALYERYSSSQPCSSNRQSLLERPISRHVNLPFSASALTSLPYDVLLNIAQLLDLLDVLALENTCRTLRDFSRTRSVWRNFAASLLDSCKPLPLRGFQRIWELETPALARTVIRGFRLQRSWSTQCPRLMIPYKVITAPPAEEIVWLSPITSKYTLCCTKTGKVLCWDVRNGAGVAEWDAGNDWEIWKCRVEFVERTVYFAMAKRLHLGPGTECQLMALKFPADINDSLPSPPSFYPLSSFTFPGPVISVYLLDPPRRLLSAYIWLEASNTLALYVLLDWEIPLYAYLDTGISCIPAQEWSCIGYDPLNVVIHAEEKERAHQYFYPLSLLEDHSSTTPPPPMPPLVAPPRTVTLPFDRNLPMYDEYWSQSSHFVRQWWPTLQTTDIRRCSCTIILLAHRDPDGMHLVTLAQHYFSIPLRPAQLRRWYVHAPFEIVYVPHGEGDGEMNAVPMIAVDFGHAVWIEYVEAGSEAKRMRFVTFPAVEVDREGEDFSGVSKEVQTLEVPAGVNLDCVCHIGIDQAQGTIILGQTDGKVYILRYE